MTFWQEFALVFTGMGVIPAICLIIGIGLVITEMFIPGFGVCGISGTILIIAGIAIRVAYAGEGNPVIQFFVLLFLVLAALGIGFMIMLRSVKKGLLSRTPIVENETAVPTGITAGLFVARRQSRHYYNDSSSHGYGVYRRQNLRCDGAIRVHTQRRIDKSR